MQEKYRPFQFVERPLDPPEEPTIPQGVSGWYNERNDEFVSDEDSFEVALSDWDLLSVQKQQLFKRFLVDLFFEDWERIRGE